MLRPMLDSNETMLRALRYDNGFDIKSKNLQSHKPMLIVFTLRQERQPPVLLHAIVRHTL